MKEKLTHMYVCDLFVQDFRANNDMIFRVREKIFKMRTILRIQNANKAASMNFYWEKTFVLTRLL